MKRTKEAFFREHPEWEQTAGISGVTTLEGEDRRTCAHDVGYYDRKNEYNAEQREAYINQMKEKKERKEADKKEQHAFDQQAIELNRQKGLLEDAHR